MQMGASALGSGSIASVGECSGAPTNCAARRGERVSS